MIEVSKVAYELLLVAQDGEKLNVTPLLRELDWEENGEEIAVRLNAKLQNSKLNDGRYVHQFLLNENGKPRNVMAFLFANWGEGRKEVFRGFVMQGGTITDPLGTVPLTAYDHLKRLLDSEDDFYYRAGTTAKAIIQDVAQKWGISLGTIEGPDVALGKQVESSDIGTFIKSVLNQARKISGQKWVMRCREGKIEVVRVGQNQPIYCFAGDNNVSRAENIWSTEKTVTRVKIIGAEDKEGRAPVVAQLDGATEYGILQKIVRQRQYDNLAAAQEAAKQILNEQGKAEWRRRIDVAGDLPFLRRGDKVYLAAGSLIGYYIVTSVVHNATACTMFLEVESVG